MASQIRRQGAVSRLLAGWPAAVVGRMLRELVGIASESSVAACRRDTS
ncbi:MAG TPA: hypothetical protein VJT72_16690 [Pseudonocardiaceae bacterium]|nr:hypothetical protein [Pseudonocardiaceae bacterium]